MTAKAISKARPKTGDARKTNQPLKIDRLPPSVHHTIQALYVQGGKVWTEIEELSAIPKDKGGFVDWENLPTEVLELFPTRRLPHSNLHRWFDLRVRQVRTETLRRADQAREIAEAFAKSNMVNGDEAVINASRDVLMGVLTEDSSEVGRMNAAKGLLKLAEVMQKAKTNEIRERKVSVDEQTLQVKLDEIKQRTEKLMKAVEGGDPNAPVQLTREQLLEQVKGIYGIA